MTRRDARRVELSDEQVRAICQRTARTMYRLHRVYSDAHALAYSPERGEVRVSGGADANPTEAVALDVRRAALRRLLPEVGAMIVLAASATTQAIEALQHADRLKGEDVGSTGSWNTETAEAAENRSTGRRQARRVRR